MGWGGVAISGLSPYVFGEVIDIFSGEKQGDFKTWILAYAFLLLLAQVFSVLESLTGQWVVTSIENRMKSRLMERILRLRSRSADGFEKGKLLNRLEFDAETVGDYYIDLVSSILMIVVNLGLARLLLRKDVLFCSDYYIIKYQGKEARCRYSFTVKTRSKFLLPGIGAIGLICSGLCCMM